jgi:hypothetical protein
MIAGDNRVPYGMDQELAATGLIHGATVIIAQA